MGDSIPRHHAWHSEGIEVNLQQILLPILKGLDVVLSLELSVKRLLAALHVSLRELIVVLDDDEVSHGVE